MNTIFSLDAGSSQSAYIIRTAVAILSMAILPNEQVLALVGSADYDVFAFEKLVPYGFVVGKEIFDTIEWNGRFRHAAEIRKGVTVFPVTRKQCVVHNCGSATGDAAVRQAMLRRFSSEDGQVRDVSGNKVKSHLWSALAISAYAQDNFKNLSGSDKAPSQRPSGQGIQRATGGVTLRKSVRPAIAPPAQLISIEVTDT